MAIHELKCHSEYFGLVQSGAKKFEVRINDRDYKIGDQLVLMNYDAKNQKYLPGVLVRTVYYILYGPAFGIKDGYCIMSLSND